MDLIVETQTYTTEEERWQAFAARDPQADGKFFIGVKTTGIFCRVLCPARQPKRENVRFFDTWQEAAAAGFRACKRCRPTEVDGAQAHLQAIIDACQVLETAETAPTLKSLAARAGLSPFHFQRVFKKLLGISPKQYFMEKRSQRMREALPASGRVTDAIYDAGFNSSARFYSQAEDTLGMSPSAFKKGGRGVEISFTVQPTPLGLMLVAATETGLCLICFGDQAGELEEELRRRFSHARIKENEATLKGWVQEVVSYLHNPAGSLNVPLDIQGTAFQRRVWSALREIPAGATETYRQVAERIGSPKAVRAVGNACANNNLAIAIPCHRVVRTDGGLGGYRWGLKRKRSLLEREKAATEGNPA